jgi:hypothetical protein
MQYFLTFENKNKYSSLLLRTEFELACNLGFYITAIEQIGIGKVLKKNIRTINFLS